MEYDGLYFLSRAFYNTFTGKPEDYLVAIAARGSHSMALVNDEPPQPISVPPVLSIQVTGATVRVSWPASDAGFVLQQSSSLDGSNWTPVSETPILVASRYEVVLPTASQMFFRLKQ